jgi:hypothetical protein
MADCPICDDYRWVCENHPERPWEGPRACDCGGAGAPCPACNPSEVTMPEMPDDFVEDRGAIPRGKFIGKPVGDDDANHFMKCEACGGWIDCRDLGSVFDHEGPLPHPDKMQ